MSVTSTQSLFQYAINALGQAFTPPCPIQSTSDLALTYTNTTTLVDRALVLNVDYIVSGAAVAGVIAAPTVTLEAAGLHYTTGGLLTIQRIPAFTQPTNLTDGNKYLAATSNNAWDRIVYQIQALSEGLKRCLQVPSTSPVQVPIQLGTRKGKLAGFDAAGNFTTYDAGGLVSQPFPSILTPSNPIYLPGIIATTGGAFNNLDGVDVTAITTPLLVIISLGAFPDENSQSWKFRPAAAGDLAISDGASVVVPVTNPNNYRWIRVA